MLVLLSVVTTSTLGCNFYGSGTNSSGLSCDDSAVDHASHRDNYYIADTTKCWGAEINAAFNQNVDPTLNGEMCVCHVGNGWHYSNNGEAACSRTRDNINQNAQYNGPEIKCGVDYFNSGTLYYSSAEDCKAGVAKLNAIIVPLATPPPPPPPPPPTEAVHLGCHCPGGSGTCYPADTTKPFNCGSMCEDHECWVGAMNEAFNDGEKLMFHCTGNGWHYAHYEANCATTRDNINQHDEYKGGPEIKCRKETKYDHYLYYTTLEDCKAGVAKLNAIMPGRIDNMPITTVDRTTTTPTHLATTTQPATQPPPKTTQKTTQARSLITTTITAVASKTTPLTSTTANAATAITKTTRTFPSGAQAGIDLLLGSSIAAKDLTESELAALKAQVIALLAKYTDLKTSDVVDVTVVGATEDRRHRSRSRRTDPHELTVRVLLGPGTSYTEWQTALTALKEKILSGDVVLSGPDAELFSLIGVLPVQPVFPTTSTVTKTSTTVSKSSGTGGGTSSGIDTDATTTVPAATATNLAGKNSGTGGTRSGIDTDATTTIPAAPASTRACPDMDPPGCGLDASKCGTRVYEMANVTETCASSAAGTKKRAGSIVGGALGGVALFLAVFGAVVYRCSRGNLGEPQPAYEQTSQNPTFNTPENAAALVSCDYNAREAMANPMSSHEDSSV
eukprot:gene8256-25647_t